ncbi:transglycosylase SLT domain-containing protein [Candidatus Micrarchaeota archaeon]|nr:transglycosylase SLT domain-containing protein [Candidatus Micrarchaeota archaeon]
MAQISQFAGIGLQDHRLCSAGVIYPDTKDGRSEQSKTLAQTIAKTMGLDVLLEKEGKGVYPDGAASAFVGTYVTGKPYKPITLGVLRNTQMPAVLVEMGSIDEPAIATEARQQQLAEQIAEGLAQAYGAMASTPTSSVDRPDPNRVTLEACIQQLKREAKGKPGPQLYRKLTLTAAAQFGINPGYYQKQIEIESGFDPNARSKAGAQGIAQFMPDTARSVGLANPFDPLPALCAGAKHMAQVYQSSAKKAYCKGKEYACALASYNAGFGAVEKYRGIPPYDETQKYVANIMGTSRSARAG